MPSTKVLVIDDSIGMRIHLRQILESAGMVVLEAADGPEGIEMLKVNHDVDLIICDVHMPHMDGLEMLKVAHEQGLLKTIPIFMLTTELAAQHVDAAKKARVTAWIIKPPNPKSLVATISKVLALESGMSGAR